MLKRHSRMGECWEDPRRVEDWWPESVKAPAGAPTVVWITICGLWGSQHIRGFIRTPTFDNLANNGLRYTNFHTIPICAPTRSALLTGRNSASVHVSGFSHTVLSAGFPGWDGRIPSSDGTIAEILREHGFNTFAVGKYGVALDAKRRPMQAYSIAGPPEKA